MDSFEINKIIAGFLGTVFVMFSVTLVADSLFAAHAPEQPGYAIEAMEAPDGGVTAPGEEEEPIAVLLASADVDAGQASFRKCVACHTAEQGGANKVGPNLWDIVNRPVASHEGFSYSSGMRAFAEGGTVWDYQHLSGFLIAPRSYVSGTAMAFGGIKNRQEEANLIAYLRTLSDNPAPLPEVPAETEAAEAPAGDAEAPAEGGEPAPAPVEPDAPGDGSAASPEDAPEEPGTEPAPAQP